MLHRETLVALAFMVITGACSSTPEPKPDSTTVTEFHGARVGSDALRSRLDSEN